MVTAFDDQTGNGRGARRRQESRRRLLAAARRLFVERGYHATRPQDIAREAEVGNGTFYLHFSDKREIFLAFAEDACAELEQALVGPLTSGAPLPQRVSEALRAALRFEESERKVIAAALMDLSIIDPGSGVPTVRPRDRLARTIAGSLEASMAAGEIRLDMPADLLAHALVGMVEQAAYHAERSGLDADALAEMLTRFLVAGLTPAA